MGTIDPFSMTDQLDARMLQVIGERLETRGRHPFFAGMLQEYIEAMHLEAADSVLDIGCGTGIAARAIARRPGFEGQVMGIDLSPYLVEMAGQLAMEEGLGNRVTFRVGDTRALDLSDESFDAVIAHTLVSHVPDPLAILEEVARVLKPGGSAGIFDGDYASLTFGHEDPLQGQSYDEALIKAVVTNPRVMRQMPRLLRAVGLELVSSFSYVLAEIGQANFWRSAIETYQRLIAKAGVMNEADAAIWANSLFNDSAEGVFFGASNYYSYVARRP